MTLLYQLIPAEGAKPRGKMPQGAQQARADAECGEEDLHLGRTRCKACPARPARGPGAGVWSRYLICETALPGRRVPTSLVGSEPCSWRELCGSEEAARGSAAQVGGALGASPLSIPKCQATGLGAEKPSPPAAAAAKLPVLRMFGAPPTRTPKHASPGPVAPLSRSWVCTSRECPLT